MHEDDLPGGNSNRVSHIGGVVQRTAGPWTPTIHALLRRIRERGVTDVPQPLGIDGLGRESLSFIPGEVANYPLPGWLWSETIWQIVAHEPAEVIAVMSPAFEG